MIDVIKS